MISETQTRFSRTLLISAKKRSSYFGGAFATSSPCGADGSVNTKRGCKLSYTTPIDASERTLDIADAPRNILTPPNPMVLYVCYMYHYLALQSDWNRLSDSQE